MTIFETEFEDYRRQCHPTAPPQIVELLRQAFAAGAVSVVGEAMQGPHEFEHYAKSVLATANLLATADEAAQPINPQLN